MTDSSTILWRRVDQPGHEYARLTPHDGGWQLAGTAVFVHQDQPCRLEYCVRCDAAWRTTAARVLGRVGPQPVEVEISVDAAGRWSLNGLDCAEVRGCVDVDLNFSPSTNVLPIRRLGLAVGEYADVRAAWLRFPSFALEALEQVYRRIGERTYRYESGGGAFVAELQVDAAGMVTRYPGIWEVEAEG